MRFIFRFIYYPILSFKKYGFSIYKRIKAMEKSQWLSRSEKDKECVEKLNYLLSSIKGKNMFYDKHIPADCWSLKTIEDIKKIPPITKLDLTEKFNDLISDIDVKAFEGNTSGSSGDPVKFYFDKTTLAWQDAAYIRFIGWHGVKPTDRRVLVWGVKSTAKSRNGILHKIKDWLHTEYKINIFNLNKDTFKETYEDLIQFKPKLFRSYTSGAKLFARLAKELGYDLKRIGFKLVVVTSEILFEEDRKFMEEVFGCRVGNEYGSSETSQIAYECTHGNLHLCDEINYIWINENKDVFVTNLHNKKFPFINYKLGDRAELTDSPCECGRESVAIKKIEGRTNDYIVAPDGTRLSQYVFYYIFIDLAKLNPDSVINYMVVQDKFHFIFNIVKGKAYSNDVEAYITDKMHERVHQSVSVQFIYKNDLERERSGKIRFFKRINNQNV